MSAFQTSLKICTFLVVILAIGQALAQKLPAPSRNVFKCENGGKVAYSDEPCLGAKRVDVEPTRGLNMTSGTEKIGNDVRQERQNEQMADALKPLFGESAKERARRHDRAKLSADSQSKCAKLDRDIPTAERQEASSASTTLASIQATLFQMRNEYRKLQC